MKPDKQLLGAAGIIVATACLIGLTWIGTLREIRGERQENEARLEATLDNQALGFSEQINRQILVLDETLRILAQAYHGDPRNFDLADWRDHLVALNGLSHDVTIAGENGVIRQSSRPGDIGQNVADEDYFQKLSRSPDPANGPFIGPATFDPIERQWHMNVARAIYRSDGSFAGVINVHYRTVSITEILTRAELGPGSFEAVIGLADARLRAAAGPATFSPDTTLRGTPVFAAIEHRDRGIWIGPSPIDGVPRIHAFRRLPDRGLAVIVAMNLDAAVRPATVWRRQADLFAGCISLLLAGMALLLLQIKRQARLREAVLAHDKTVLASANAQLETARSVAIGKAQQLGATLSGMTDGVCMFDADMRLVEWNERYPEVAGVPAEILRVGLPLEDVLRAQIAGGQLGVVDDPDAEITRRLAQLRSGRHATVQRQRPDGHTVELRRKHLPDGGFVTLIADITEHKRTEAALREAREAAEAATAAKSRFVAIVSHEIRTPLNALLNTLKLLASSVMAPAQLSLLATTRQSGDALSGLVNDILEMSQIEAGKMMIRPGNFDLRTLLASSMEMFNAAAAERGIALRLSISEAVPVVINADAGRLRQILLNLLSNAVKYADNGDVWLHAEAGRNAAEGLRLLVKDRGPVIGAAARRRLFQPFSRLERSDNNRFVGSGLGLSICQELVTLMGGTIGCEPWTAPDGQQGNVFWLALPASILSVSPPAVSALPAMRQLFLDLPRRPLPRTRILLVEDVVANQIVVATMLRREGHMVDVASTGESAVEAAQRSHYDLIFMDIFLPGMSGQEATAVIRSLPEPTRSVPIIALTADASPHFETLIRAFGIDGVLGKPVSLAALQDAVNDHVWSGQRVTRTDGPPDVPVPARGHPGRPDVAGDNAMLAADRIHELRRKLPPQVFATLIEACLVDLDARMRDLSRAIEAGSIGAIAAHTHAMVGMACGYGMTSLEASLRDIMAAARTGDIALLGSDALWQVKSDLASADRAFRQMLQAEAIV
jgi:signal transduction histidine kinase/CheY-like chemotaxis protein